MKKEDSGKQKVMRMLGLAVALMLLPAIAAAGEEPVGACWNNDLFGGAIPGDLFGGAVPGDVEGVSSFAVCIDGLTENECDLVSKGVANWSQGEDCDQLKFPWDGSCLTPFFEPVLGDDTCFVMWFDEGAPFTAEENCVKVLAGEWFEGSTTCGGAPVPAMPKAAYAALALVLLAGTLTLLTVYSRP